MTPETYNQSYIDRLQEILLNGYTEDDLHTPDGIIARSAVVLLFVVSPKTYPHVLATILSLVGETIEYFNEQGYIPDVYLAEALYMIAGSPNTLLPVAEESTFQDIISQLK